MPTQSSSLLKIFRVFFLIGLQSFGGGSSTFLMVHEACLKNGWVDEETFTRDWALAQISPGINLLKLTMLVGSRLRGWSGVVVATAGLVVPSALITTLMTAGFTLVRSIAWVQAALKGVLPATIGLSVAMGVQLAAPLLGRAQREGGLQLGMSLFILAGAALLMGCLGFPPLLVLLISGGAAMGSLALISLRAVKAR